MKTNDTIAWLHKLRLFAENDPEGIIIVDHEGQRSVSYSAFYRMINSYALYMKKAGLQKGDMIAIELGRVAENHALRMASLFIGVKYVSVNPDYPEDRKQLIYQACDPSIIMDEPYVSMIPLKDVPCQIDETIDDEAEAYIDFTSGTTGIPKGILHDRSVFPLTEIVVSVFTACGGVRSYAALADMMFALSIGDFAFALIGITLHIISDETKRDPGKLKAYFMAQNINSTTMLPSMLRMLAPFPTLRMCVTVGEKNDYDYSDLDMEVINFYGASECNALSYGYKGTDEGIGRAFAGTRVFLEDEDGNIIDPKDTEKRGEFCYSGPGIMIRYLGNEDLTQQAVKLDPLTGKKVFHTRDVGRYNPDGSISIFGRIDSTVKIRGNRVNLAEIEYHLLHCEGVIEAAARAFEVNNENILCAFYTTKDRKPLPEDAIRAVLEKKMPAYMMPAYIVHIGAFARNLHGKIDREALKLPERAGMSACLPPQDEAEKKVAEIFEEILEKTPIGREDRFSELGGSSLSALRLQLEITDAFEVSISATDLLRLDSVSAIAAAVRHADRTVPVQPEASGIRQDAIPLIDSSRFIWDNVVKLDRLGDRRPISYNTAFLLKITGLSVEEITEKYRMVFDAHPGLKTRLEVKDGTPALRKQDDWKPVFTLTDLSEEPDTAFFKNRVRRFDLPQDPLIRCELYQYRETFYAFVDIHHQILDGYSRWLLLKDLKKAFTGKRPGKEARTFLDELEAIHASSERDDESRAYYHALLEGTESLLYPVSQTPDSDLPLYGNCILDVPVPGLITRGNADAVTPHHVILAAFMSALETTTGKHSFSIVSFYSGRTEETASTAGCLYRHMPVVCTGSENATLAELAKAYRQQTQESEKHRFICDLYPEVGTDVVFNDLSDYPRQDLLPGTRLSDQCINLGVIMSDMDYANIPLQVRVLATTDNGCRIGISYNRKMYHSDAILNLLQQTAERLKTF